jgi:hypothetical protein
MITMLTNYFFAQSYFHNVKDMMKGKALHTIVPTTHLVTTCEIICSFEILLLRFNLIQGIGHTVGPNGDEITIH